MDTETIKLAKCWLLPPPMPLFSDNLWVKRLAADSSRSGSPCLEPSSAIQTWQLTIAPELRPKQSNKVAQVGVKKKERDEREVIVWSEQHMDAHTHTHTYNALSHAI